MPNDPSDPRNDPNYTKERGANIAAHTAAAAKAAQAAAHVAAPVAAVTAPVAAVTAPGAAPSALAPSVLQSFEAGVAALVHKIEGK